MSLNHVAIIPDGNRRFARGAKLSLWNGYKKGAAQFEQIMKESFRNDVRYLTFWAASIDNLQKRSKQEVAFLVRLLKSYLKEMVESSDLMDEGVQVRIVGDGAKIVKDKELDKCIAALEQKTEKNKDHFLTILFGYDGRKEVLEAARKMGGKKGEEEFRKNLQTGSLPDLDLVIRTGGEPHWSAGFMMWQAANTDFYFTEKLWPQFTKADLRKALSKALRREKRLGK
ncbi:MAG: polyprenyl diphosphate synthase [Candidatus Paceibacterota bacterium]